MVQIPFLVSTFLYFLIKSQMATLVHVKMLDHLITYDILFIRATVNRFGCMYIALAYFYGTFFLFLKKYTIRWFFITLACLHFNSHLIWSTSINRKNHKTCHLPCSLSRFF